MAEKYAGNLFRVIFFCKFQQQILQLKKIKQLKEIEAI